MKIVLLILQYKGFEHTSELFESITPQLPYDDSVEIVIIDNASPDGFHDLYEYLEKPVLEEINARYLRYKSGRWLHLLRSVENLGYGRGNNLGAAYAFEELKASHVWVLNNDTILYPDALTKLKEYLYLNSNAHLIGQTILDYGTRRVQALAGAQYNPFLAIGKRICAGQMLNSMTHEQNIEGSLDYLTGASFVITRELYEKIGLFDPMFFLYFEEIDLAKRARSLGVKLHWSPFVVIEHKEGASISPLNKSSLSEYHATLSSLLVTRKHYSILLPLTILLRSIYKLPKYILNKQWQLVRAHLSALRDFLFKGGGGL